MPADGLFAETVREHRAVLDRMEAALAEPLDTLMDRCRRALAGGGKVLFFGNGGSAADAQHLATELVCRYERTGGALAAVALTTDTSLLTATSNDFGYDAVFERQVNALARPGDVAIGISTSGRSASITRGLRAALAADCTAAALSGKDGGDLPGLAEPLLVVPSERTARIQEMHIMLGHMLCQALEAERA